MLGAEGVTEMGVGGQGQGAEGTGLSRAFWPQTRDLIEPFSPPPKREETASFCSNHFLLCDTEMITCPLWSVISERT